MGSGLEFRSGIPTRLTSWQEKGLSWGSSGELTGLQTCIQNMVNKKLKLVNVVHVMLIRRILPCQQRAFDLWEFNPAQHRTRRSIELRFSAQHHASAVSCLYLLQGISFS